MPEDADPSAPEFQTWPYVDRRHMADRRARPTRWYDVFLGGRKRKAGRRVGERDNVYVDRFERKEVAIIVFLFVLNVLDAALTLVEIARGGSEANPVMRSVLELGPGWFIAEKLVVVGVCILTIAVHKNFRAARLGTITLVGVYTLLTLYHGLLGIR